MKNTPLITLTDEKWDIVKRFLPKHRPSPLGGRPRVDDKRCFEAVLWILRTGSPWAALPREYGASTTCWRRLHEWQKAGSFQRMWASLVRDLEREHRLDFEESFIDGSFVSAKKGVLA